MITNHEFTRSFPVTVNVLGRDWNLTCTAMPDFWAENPILLWVDKGDEKFLPEQVWDAVEAALADKSSPVRRAWQTAFDPSEL